MRDTTPEQDECKTHVEMPVEVLYRTLYPEWEEVGNPWFEGEKWYQMIRKSIGT